MTTELSDDFYKAWMDNHPNNHRFSGRVINEDTPAMTLESIEEAIQSIKPDMQLHGNRAAQAKLRQLVYDVYGVPCNIKPDLKNPPNKIFGIEIIERDYMPDDYAVLVPLTPLESIKSIDDWFRNFVIIKLK